MNIATLSTGVVIVIWGLAVLFIALVVTRATRNQPVRNASSILGGLVVLAILMTALNAGLVFIKPEERGVVISAVDPQGYRSQALTPGLHWIIPFAENVVIYPISRQNYTMSSTPGEGQVQGDDSIAARTADGQQISIDASVIYEINPDKVIQVHIAWQNRYSSDLVRALSRGIIRDAISQYNVEEVVSTKRDIMAAAIHDQLATKFDQNGLTLVDFILRNISFSPEYAASVEQKQIAEQQAEQAKFVVDQRKQEAEQARQQAQGLADSAVIKAKGDAEARLVQAQAEAQALEMIAKALANNPDLLTYQYISKLSPGVQVMLLPSNSPFVFNLPTVVPGAPTTTETPAPTAVPTTAPTPAPTATP
jgi:regulator of protease activity HflC (stomatin/prohibitin superfamily)